jgi:hypothetical protein
MRKEFKILIVIVVASLGILLLQGHVKRDEVIDTSQPVTKLPDEVKTVTQGKGEMVQVRFYWEVQGLKYNDALYIPKDQYAKMSEEDLDKLKRQRFDNWVNSINESSKNSGQ